MEKRKKITSKSKKPLTYEEKRKNLEKNFDEWNDEYEIEYCFNAFIIAQTAKGNSKATIDFYKRFYKKFSTFMSESFDASPKDTSIEMLQSDLAQPVFMNYLEEQGVNKQTVNSYLRGLRSFGNWCEEEGYLQHFKCPIKEIIPPAKEVYTDSEIEKLLVKPKKTDFSAWRAYCVISLVFSTGARSNTILNIRIRDVDLAEGVVAFNTTKNHEPVRLGLVNKTKRDLAEWIDARLNKHGAEPDDFLFCNEYGEQLSRNALAQCIAKYNKSRGVEKTSLHLMRHTFAKKWITSGGDIVTLAKVMTHKELEMVKRYANLYDTDLRNEIKEHSIMSQTKTKSGSSLRGKKSIR